MKNAQVVEISTFRAATFVISDKLELAVSSAIRKAIGVVGKEEFVVALCCRREEEQKAA